MPSNVRILGIDPGTAIIGFAVIEPKSGNNWQPVTYGAIRTASGLSDTDRLIELANDLRSILKKYKPQAVSVEKLFFATNQKTAINVSQARGVILLCCAEAGCSIIEFTPLQVKQRICGFGQAEKKQVQRMVKELFKLAQTPKPDDVADALALAWCAIPQLKQLQLLGGQS